MKDPHIWVVSKTQCVRVSPRFLKFLILLKKWGFKRKAKLAVIKFFYRKHLYYERNDSGSIKRRKMAHLVRRDKGCLICGSTKRLTIDHVIPRSKGGSNKFSNMQLLCFRHNQEKGAKTLDLRRSK